jgi:hypothetical protein
MSQDQEVYPPDKQRLLFVADGPEHIEIYISDEEAVSDWAHDSPALYLTASVNGSYVEIGPFQLAGIRKGVEDALKGNKACPSCGYKRGKT